MKKFSILICSLQSRKAFLDRLLGRLTPQLTDEVEFLIDTDNGEKPIGKKRNDLLERATGDFIAFIDDDDLISNNYVLRILSAIETKPDCVGIEGIITFDYKNPKRFIHSIQYKTWFEKDGIYYRCCNHLNPIKKEISIQVKFPEINQREDRVYSYNVLPLLSTEVYISEPIYYYEFLTNKVLKPMDENAINNLQQRQQFRCGH